MKRFAGALALVCIAGCSSPEFAPDALISSPDGGEIAVRSWEFCGPVDGGGHECLDSLPGDDLMVLSVPSNGWWTIDRPTGYTWAIRYRIGEPDHSTFVMSHETTTGSHIDEIPEPGRYLVEMSGRADEAGGAWTFELIVRD